MIEYTATTLLQTAANAVAQIAIAGLWQGPLLLSTTAVSLRLLPRASASTRFLVWSAAFVAVVLLPIAELHGRDAGNVAGKPPMVHADARWALAIAVLWAALALFRAAELVWHAVSVWGVWRRATPLEQGGFSLPAGRRRATLCRSAEVDAPCVIGFFAPRLLVPDSLAETMTAEELRQIALHECEHLRRGDDWSKLTERVAMALFPLNPALPWMSRRLSREREMACDAGVVQVTAAPLAYARCLTELAERRVRAKGAVSALLLSAWGARPELVERVHRLLRPGESMTRARARVATSLLCAGLAGGAAGLAHAPQLISFSGGKGVAQARVEQTPTPLEPMTEKVEHVSFRAPAAASELRMMPAVARMPVRSQSGETRARTIRRTDATRRNPVAAELSVSRTTRTSASAPALPPGRTRVIRGPRVYVLRTDFSPSYAAVPFGDGWLIVQL